MEAEPLVSIILPTYNRCHTIPRAINSVLNQTYTNWELIIVDDGSTDGTKNLLRELIHDKRIKYHYKKNKGPSSARNFGVSISKGTYICFLDSDDEFVANKLIKHIFEMKKFNAPASISNVRVYYPHGKKIRVYNKKRFLVSYQNLIDSKIGSLMNIVIKKGIIKNLKLDPTLSIAEDLDLILRILESNQSILFINETLLNVYKDTNNKRLSSDYDRKIKNYLFLISKFQNNPYRLSNEHRDLFLKKFYLELGFFYCLKKDYLNARVYIDKGMVFQQEYKISIKYKILHFVIQFPKILDIFTYIGLKLWNRGLIKL